MKNKNSLWMVLGVVLVIAIIAGIYYNTYNKKDIKIGVIGTLTGAGSFFGQQEIKGLEIARDIINSEGGINGRKISLLVEDSQTKNELTVTSFNKLVNIDGVKFIIGDTWNANTATLVPLANENNILVISPVTALNSLSQDDMFFRTVPTIKEMAYYLANYAYSNNIRTAATLGVAANPFSEEHANYFKEEFERLGGKVVEMQYIQLNQNDVRTELTKIKDKNPQAIFISISSTAMVNPLKQIKEFGMDVTIFGGFGTESGALIKDYADLSEGVLYPYFYNLELETPESNKFIEAYNLKYNQYPDSTAVNAYDALRIISNAIANVGEDPVKVKEYILTQEYNLAGGKINFDYNGDAKKEIFMKKIKSGAFVIV